MLLAAGGTTLVAASQSRPNIVLIMVDDMGFSDIGCYGAETETPHLDQLAKNGLRFTQFYNAGRCCPTRAALLTGLYQHQAGVGHMTGDDGHPSYRGFLNARCVTIAEVLGTSDYFSAICGKWHVGSAPEHWPLRRGFDRFYGTPQGGGHHYRNLPGRDLVLDDKIIPMPKEWYSTTAFTDHAVQFIDEGVKSNRPVFLYVAYTAPHWALHAPDEEIAKFRGRYTKGWQPVREARFERQLKMGMFPSHTRLSDQDPNVPAWHEVENPEEMDLRMATHAAMVHLVDRGVGRIVSKLNELEQLDNTLILFLSDNGASAESGPTGFTGARGGDPKARTGTPNSYNSFGIAGANMCDTPFRKYKMFVHEGGIATPLIAHWPNGIPAKLNGRFSHEVGHVIDLLPTCADVAGAIYPQVFEGRAVTPVAGRSLKPAFNGNSLERPEGLYFEHQGNSAVRLGNWKLVRAHRQPWTLYNLEADRTELADVSEQHPDQTLELKTKWKAWAERVGVQPWPIKKKLVVE
ncbi:arylsulfatase [Stieleria magnilauensis]|uniref:arylsulfatase n=1 Tax=Stieleria magnilauensis TaxID=2527963 RepID=UPI003AF86174